jgi:hypothetical protein
MQWYHTSKLCMFSCEAGAIYVLIAYIIHTTQQSSVALLEATNMYADKAGFFDCGKPSFHPVTRAPYNFRQHRHHVNYTSHPTDCQGTSSASDNRGRRILPCLALVRRGCQAIGQPDATASRKTTRRRQHGVPVAVRLSNG